MNFYLLWKLLTRGLKILRQSTTISCTKKRSVLDVNKSPSYQEVTKVGQKGVECWIWFGSSIKHQSFYKKKGRELLSIFGNDPKVLTLPKISLLLKTKNYFTDWHFDLTDTPAIVILWQLIGETLVFSAPGLIGVHLSAKRWKDYSLVSDSVKEFLATDTKIIGRQHKHHCLLHPGEFGVVCPHLMHEAHVPDKCNFSIVAAYVIELEALKPMLPKHGFIFGASANVEQEEEQGAGDDNGQMLADEGILNTLVTEVLKASVNEMKKALEEL